MRNISTTFASIALVVAFTNLSHAESKYKFKKGELVKVSGKTCGLVSNRWKPVKKSGTKYVVDKKGGSRCKGLLAPGSLKSSGLAKIPSAGTLLKTSHTGTSALAVIGTPPAVTAIPGIGAKNLFWSAGFIDALQTNPSPSQDQCDEFFAGNGDGTSSGMLGCSAVQSVGFSCYETCQRHDKKILSDPKNRSVH